MAMPSQSPPLPAPRPPEVYSPMSALAIVGLLFGLASLLIFMLEAPWLLLFLSLPALIISIIARRRIANSDGTLAGRALTTAGLILALISGLGWVTAYVTNYLIVYQESSLFLDNWLAKLQDRKAGEAFLDTVAYNRRKVPFDPNDLERLRVHFPTSMGGGSEFDGFRGSPYVALALRYGDRFTWQRLGWPEKKYDKGNYTAKYRYQIDTPDMSETVEFAVKADEQKAADAPQRPWKIEVSDIRPAPGSTRAMKPYGEKLFEAYYTKAVGKTDGVLNNWIRDIATGNRTNVFKLALTPADTRDVMVTGVASLLAAAPTPTGFAAGPVPTSLSSFGLSPAAPKLYDLHELYAALRRDRGLQEPGWLLLKDEQRGENSWTFDLRCVVQSMAFIYEFTLSLDGDLGSNPPVWHVRNYKLISEKKKPPNPMDMMGR